MSISTPFIQKAGKATTLSLVAVTLAGGNHLHSVAGCRALPEVDFPDHLRAGWPSRRKP